MHFLRSYFVCKFPDSGYVSAHTVSKASRTTNFSEQEKLLLVELGRDFPGMEKQRPWKYNVSKKRQKHGMKFLTNFKRDLNQLQGRRSAAVKNSRRKKGLTFIVVKQEKLGEE